MTAKEALEKLKEGNERFLRSASPTGDVSPARREETAQNGQHPYAAVLACSDSRVIPEHIFSAGIGELFTIRSAGNTVGPTELGSAAYAVDHLGVPLVVVLGHTHCGAVASALQGHAEGRVKVITDAITRALGPEREPDAASILNARHSAAILRRELGDAAVVAALYHIDTGKVEFFEESR